MRLERQAFRSNPWWKTCPSLDANEMHLPRRAEAGMTQQAADRASNGAFAEERNVDLRTKPAGADAGAAVPVAKVSQLQKQLRSMIKAMGPTLWGYRSPSKAPQVPGLVENYARG